MIAIETRYLGPTNTRGSRIKATANGYSVTVPYPYNKRTGAEAHSVAALALCRKVGWADDLIAGSTDRGYVFVFAQSAEWDRYTNPLSREEADAIQRERIN